ncbi:MAG TPA: metallophosphoesterase [Sphingomonas sp.]
MPLRHPLSVALALSIFLAGSAQAAKPQSDSSPDFSIGAIADCQYAAEPDAPPRLYHTAPGKLAAAVADFNRQRLAFVVHLGDFVDRDWQSFDALLPITARLRHPWHFVLGNHDFAVDDGQKAHVPAKLGMPARYYSFVVTAMSAPRRRDPGNPREAVDRAGERRAATWWQTYLTGLQIRI